MTAQKRTKITNALSFPKELTEPGESEVKRHRFFILKHDKNTLEQLILTRERQYAPQD